MDHNPIDDPARPGVVSRSKLAVASVVTAVFVLGTAALAGATPTAPTFDPAAEATGLFSDNWDLVLDMVKAMAPIAIGAGLVIFVIRKVTRSLARGKAPSGV